MDRNPQDLHSSRASGDRLGALLDAAVDPIVLIDTRGRISGFNRAAERVFGYTESELLGRNVSVLMPLPYREEHDGYLDRYLGTGAPRIIGIGREVVAQRKDGSTFPIDLAVGEFVSGAERGFVGILRDITQRKRHEAEIRAATEELRLIFENTPTAITITDVHGHVLDANRACEFLLGFPAGELKAMRHTDLLADEDRALVSLDFQRLRASGERFSREVRYRRKDGQLLYALLQAGVARDEGGQALLMICEIVDRSQVFKATREAEELRTRLAHVGRIGTLGEMVSGIAHEVNQPLTAIANYANAARRLVLSGSTDAEELATIHEKIAAQAERAGQVIRGLRSMTRKHESVRERLDCATLIVEASRLVEFELRARGWRLLLELAPELPPLWVDGVQIQQVLLNLVRNGVESMSERAAGDTITIAAAPAGRGWVEIGVRDSGPGLSAEAEERLFEPFFTTKAQGMGLGLSICKSIMSAHGGELRYRRSAAGEAEFIMRLPVYQP
jgi:two-component system sensor kinase FixL